MIFAAILMAALRIAPAQAGAEPLKLLTINVAGIPFVHPKLQRRMKGLGGAFAAGGYDLIALQEAWRDEDADYLSKRAGLPYYERFPRDVAIGTGLAFLARWPLEHKEQRVFTLRPSPLRVAQGEWPANKGVLYAQLQTPAGPLDVYDTHLISDYPDAPYKTIRMAQLFELAEEIELRSAGRPFVLMGDFNAGPGEDGYALIQDLLDLEDPCVVAKKDECGATLDDGRRVDQILVPRGGARFVKARRVLDGKAGGLALSDHAGLEALVDPRLLTLKPRRSAAARARRLAALAAVRDTLDQMLTAMVAREARRSWIPVYGFLMSLRYARERDQVWDIRTRAETARLVELEGAPAGAGDGAGAGKRGRAR